MSINFDTNSNPQFCRLKEDAPDAMVFFKKDMGEGSRESGSWRYEIPAGLPGNFYQLASETKAYYGSLAACRVMGGNMACPRNELQNQMIRTTGGGSEVWLGVSDVMQEGVFKCTSGETADWNNFAGGEPSNTFERDTEADYVAMKEDGTWVAKGALAFNTYKLPAVCEISCTTGSSQQCFPDDLSTVKKVYVTDVDASTEQIDPNPESWPEYMVISGNQRVTGGKGRKYIGVRTTASFRAMDRACRKNPRILGHIACPRNTEQQAVVQRLSEEMMSDVWLGVDESGVSCSNGDTLDYGNFASERGSDSTVVMSYSSDSSLHGQWKTAGGRAFGVCEQECEVGSDSSCVPDDISSVGRSTLRLADEVRGLQFSVTDVPATYAQAVASCEAQGGSLACPRNLWHQSAIKSQIRTLSWIGITGQEICLDGDILDIANWQGVSRPRKGLAAIMTPDGRWSIGPESVRYSYVCEIPCKARGVISDCIPLSFPADLDVNVFIRAAQVDLSPLLLEALDILIMEFDERDLLTKPWEAKTLPGTEEPPIPIEIDGRHIDREGAIFSVIYEKTKFWDAVDRCEEMMMKLACPQNNLQQQYITSKINSTTWLGISDTATEGSFVCMDGSQQNFEAWLPTEPDNKIWGSPEGDFVSMIYLPNTKYHGRWMDEAPHVEHHYACSKECVVGSARNCIPNNLLLAETAEPGTSGPITLPVTNTEWPTEQVSGDMADRKVTKVYMNTEPVTTTEKMFETDAVNPTEVPTQKDESMTSGSSSETTLTSLNDYLITYYNNAPGRVFKYVSSSTNFWDAEISCSDMEMTLACPQNKLQQATINQVIRSTSWIGFADYYTDGEFFCMSGGDVLQYTNWGLDQPDNTYLEDLDADFTVVVYDKNSPNHLKWEDTGSYDFPEHMFGAVCQIECTVGNMDGCIPDQ